MTTQEFSIEFDILYNNLASDAAPPLNEYEKSVFLTKAQSDIVIELYSGRNHLGLSFESSEEVRRYLRPLIRYNSTDLLNPTSNIPNTSTGTIKKWYDVINKMLVISFYRPATVEPNFYDKIIYPGIGTIREELIYTQVTSDNKIQTYTIPVIPSTHDELYKILKNPFKRPKNFKRALRIDGFETEFLDIPIQDQDNKDNIPVNTGASVCIYVDNIDGKDFNRVDSFKYKEWYIQYPSPIMLPDTTIPSSAKLTIQGEDYGSAMECMLPESLHRMILDRAVLYAKQAYVGDQAQRAQQE